MRDGKRVRVLVADDHCLVAAGVSKLLGVEFDVLGYVADGRELVARARFDRPDVVVLDISMPNLNGIDAARELRTIVPDCKLVIISVHSDIQYVAAAFHAGASAYVLKRSAASELVAAVHAVLNGAIYLTPIIDGPALQQGLNRQKSRKAILSPRQSEILQLVAEGRRGKEIARIFGNFRQNGGVSQGSSHEKVGFALNG
jgi:DNA-binding NarL/FixJ family response regulator